MNPNKKWLGELTVGSAVALARNGDEGVYHVLGVVIAEHGALLELKGHGLYQRADGTKFKDGDGRIVPVEQHMVDEWERRKIIAKLPTPDFRGRGWCGLSLDILRRFEAVADEVWPGQVGDGWYEWMWREGASALRKGTA